MSCRQIKQSLHSIWMISNTSLVSIVDVVTIPCGCGASTTAPWYYGIICYLSSVIQDLSQIHKSKICAYITCGLMDQAAPPPTTSWMLIVDMGTIPCGSGEDPWHITCRFVPGDTGRKNWLPEALLSQPWFLGQKILDPQMLFPLVPRYGISWSKGPKF